MSGSNGADDDGFNMLAGTARAPSISVPVQGQGPQPQPSAPLNHAMMQAHVLNHMSRMTPQDVMRHRDVAGREMETLAAVASGSKVMTRADVAAYLGNLTAKGDINPAEMQEMLQSLPRNEQGIRQWARAMFSVAMLRGIHGHAAYPLSLYPAAAEGDAVDQQQQPEAAPQATPAPQPDATAQPDQAGEEGTPNG